MNLNYLQEFVVLSECSSITKAARELYISQPALSKHIVSLEKELGVTLIDRGTKETALTPYGKAFLDYARQISFQYDAAVEKMTQIKKSMPVSLRLVSFNQYEPLLKLLRDTIFILKEEFPLLEVEILGVKNTSPFDEVRSGNVDLCIFVAPSTTDVSNFEIVPLYKEEMCIITRKENPLAEQSEISPEDIDGTIVHFPLGEATRELMEAYEELLISKGARPKMSGFPWAGTHSYFEYYLDKGVFFETAGAAHNLLPSAFVNDYKVLLFKEPFYKTTSIYYRSDNKNPVVPLFVEVTKKIIVDNNPDYLEPLDRTRSS